MPSGKVLGLSAGILVRDEVGGGEMRAVWMMNGGVVGFDYCRLSQDGARVPRSLSLWNPPRIYAGIDNQKTCD